MAFRIKLDENFSPYLAETFRAAGHDAHSVLEENLSGSDDLIIYQTILAENRLLITFDLDFGEILALGVIARPSVVIFRLSDERADFVNQRIEWMLSEQAEALASGALILVEDARYRVRRM